MSRRTAKGASACLSHVLNNRRTYRSNDPWGYGWGDTAISLQLESWLEGAPGNRLILLHPNLQELSDHSWTMAASHRRWRETGRLVIIPKWLSQVSMADLQTALA
jgi:hypothetical protein